ncbi:AAA family ATPase [Psychrobacter sp. I-STPA10]|uniref:AAA family ATPase n=1 Tax=Psychrobacter sp. I-STPA10 TaxID=2585769 RepID=UPI001E438909|nr:AAA family ATPase [Psychrobacter sp. I-STPA10]
MAKRIYKLPRQDQLTKEQRKILRLPEQGDYLIVGAPGTGKSVVALMRLQNLVKTQNVHFLTFNHVLNHANKCLVDEKLQDNMHTAMSWFYSLYWENCQVFVPEEDNYQPDYDAVMQDFQSKKLELSDHSLIIDEGQDLPPQWYEAVDSLNINNFFIVADQNQQITEQNSSREDIEICLGLDSDEVIELKENWRNTMPIALFCNYFYTDKGSPKPVIPNRPSINIPILYEYEKLDSVKEQILREYHFDPSKLIGVFVATDAKREDWVRRLANDNQPRNNPSPVITTYSSSQKGDVHIDFSQGGIVVLSDKSVKGIEFDVVFIQTDGFNNKSGSEERLKKRLYVMSSRAKEKLYLFKSHIYNSILEEILPPEGEVVKFIPEGETKELEQELLKRRKL